MTKKLFTFSLTLATICTLNSQVIIDTVSTGTGYANQVWYSLANNNQASAPKNNWDLAFDVSGQGSSIHINSVNGITLWNYPNADTSGWNTLDTIGITSWKKRWNSDTAWTMGAMGRYAVTSNPNDMDWGIYSSITHVVTGDSLYVIKLSNGTYKKLRIINLSGGAYNFRYADLNGSNTQNVSLAKSSFINQNFGYYSILNNAPLTREPVSSSWDLLFTQYTAFLNSQSVITPYSVTGILQNKSVRVAKVKQVVNPGAYVDWNQNMFKTAINEIGYDWKTFTTSYVIEDSLVYFVKAKNGDIWKVIPTGFSGSSNGNFIFTKEKLSAVGIKQSGNYEIASFALYPNPSSGEDVSLVLSVEEITSHPILSVYDVNGKLLQTTALTDIKSNEVNVFRLNTENLSSGVLNVVLTVENNSCHQKLILNK